MVLVNENIALVIFGVILLVSAAVAWYMGTYSYYDSGRFHTFIAVLAGLGVFVTFMFYYNVLILQNQQQEIAALDELARVNTAVLGSVLNEIKAASTIIPNFTLSITPLANTACCAGSTGGGTGTCVIPVDPDPVNPQTCTEKFVLSFRIFSLWQDVILSSKFISSPLGYVSSFLQFANSSQLYSQWQVSYIDFTSKTQTFGNLLFEYGLPITVQTSETYQTAAETLINDPRFQSLIG